MVIYQGPLIGCSAKAEELRDEVQKVARTNLTVMIRGERGTGKDLVAGEVHLKSNRAGSFVRVNCAGLPEELVETELFGCEKGAYTGAEARKGKFEQAHGGTIFLDEVGELSPKAQPKLLHVTETLAVDRVGGQRSIPVDFRLVVATNRNLEEMVRQGKFREDLYDRLNMDAIRVPALRERMEDIPLLAEYFRDRYANEAKRVVTHVSQQVLDLFQSTCGRGMSGNSVEAQIHLRLGGPPIQGNFLVDITVRAAQNALGNQQQGQRQEIVPFFTGLNRTMYYTFCRLAERAGLAHKEPRPS